MQHGENGAPLSRGLAKILGKRMCGHDPNTDRKWTGGTLFNVAEADMSKVKVEVKSRRIVKRD